MTISELLIPSFTQSLNALSAWLAKGAAFEAAAGRDPDGLTGLRIAPDMYPLATQVCFCCYQGQEFAYRLQDEPLPEALLQVRLDGLDRAERPGTVADAQAQIAAALELLSKVEPGAIDGAAGRPLAHELPSGHVFDMTGEQFARDWALPQFYFHLIAAYAILRAHGVPLGKIDYVPHMFGYLREGTGPTA
jgi:hypothetical protein